jgi:hypothetical protein
VKSVQLAYFKSRVHKHFKALRYNEEDIVHVSAMVFNLFTRSVSSMASPVTNDLSKADTSSSSESMSSSSDFKLVKVLRLLMDLILSRSDLCTMMISWEEARIFWLKQLSSTGTSFKMVDFMFVRAVRVSSRKAVSESSIVAWIFAAASLSASETDLRLLGFLSEPVGAAGCLVGVVFGVVEVRGSFGVAAPFDEVVLLGFAASLPWWHLDITDMNRLAGGASSESELSTAAAGEGAASGLWRLRKGLG